MTRAKSAGCLRGGREDRRGEGKFVKRVVIK